MKFFFELRLYFYVIFLQDAFCPMNGVVATFTRRGWMMSPCICQRVTVTTINIVISTDVHKITGLSLLQTCWKNLSILFELPSRRHLPFGCPMAIPACYAGDPAGCGGFLFQVWLYIEMQPQRFTTKRSKVAFLICVAVGKGDLERPKCCY